MAAACALALPAGAGASLDVWFLQDGRLVPVPRQGSTLRGAVAALLAGPSTRERARGVRTAVPAGAPLRDLSVERRVVTVDLGARFAAGSDELRLRARVAQLVRTVSSVPGVAGVRVLIEGGTPIGLFPGIDLRRALRPAAVAGAVAPGTRELQRLLADLGFLDEGAVTGVLDGPTEVAVLGFEKWRGLARDGVLDAATVSALLHASRPLPVEHEGAGRRIEVLLDRQVALLIEDDRVQRVVHISTGAPGTSTPAGSFRVYRKERYSWSIPFSVWMPWASYINGGIAFHEYSSVPVYPASHGCIRVNRYDAPGLYAFAVQGTPVRVLWRS
jgi:hypothetical protein